MTEFPAHASPAFPSTHARPSSPAISDVHLSTPQKPDSGTATPASTTARHIPAVPEMPSLPPQSDRHNLPPSLISPAITPPGTPHTSRRTSTRPALLETLPHVECVARARIPTRAGATLFLHVYTNDVDNKEHLALVYGSQVRSTSLDRPRPGETEMQRMIRGAYTGRLHPGQTSSRVGQLRREAGVGGVASPSSSNVAQPESSQNHKESSSPNQDTEASCAPLVRIHSECYTGETIWSTRCDCGEQLEEAARLMSDPDCSGGNGGVIIYLRQEGRGIGLGEKLKAYNLQDLGNDTYEANILLRHPADARSYGLATAMLIDLGLGGPKGIRLLTNNPDKVSAVEGPNREVIVRERVSMVPLAWQTKGERGVRGEELDKYLETKREKFSHYLPDLSKF